MLRRDITIAIFTPANLNAIDGSSVWAQSVALALSSLRGTKVKVLSSHRLVSDRIVGPLRNAKDVEVIDPFVSELADEIEPLALGRASELLESMTRWSADFVIVRGAAAAEHLATVPALKGRLLPYLTDVPQRASEITDADRDRMEVIMRAAPLLLCQTNELKKFLTEQFQSIGSKAFVLPPMIPDDVVGSVLEPPTPDYFRLCYSGKFASAWNTLEMCDLPSLLEEWGMRASLTMVGDKINKDPKRPEFVAEMRNKLETSPGVNWVGGVSRAESIKYMSQAHVGLSWRDESLDDSLELSTKLLEYCGAGTPPVLNRTQMHEEIFGSEYPLFVDRDTPIVDILRDLASDEEIYKRALEVTSTVTANYTFEGTAPVLLRLIDTARG